LSFTIDQDSVSASKVDTVSGTIRAEDPDGIDSVWVSVDAELRGESGGFNRVFSARYRFLLPPGSSRGSASSSSSGRVILPVLRSSATATS